MTAAAFERQAQLLETIHGAARELRDLVGNALVITIEPAKTGNGKPPVGAVPGSAGEAALNYLRGRPGEWVAVREIIAATGKTTSTVAHACKKLQNQGVLEHNGRKTRAARFRFPQSSPETPPARNGGHLVTGEQGASAAAPSHAAAWEGTQTPPPKPDGLQEVRDRIVQSCADDAATVTELAMRLDVPRRAVVPLVLELVTDGRLEKCGKRPPLQHDVYGATE